MSVLSAVPSASGWPSPGTTVAAASSADGTKPGRMAAADASVEWNPALERIRSPIGSPAEMTRDPDTNPASGACNPSPEVVLLVLGLANPDELLHITPKVSRLWHRLSKTASNTCAAAAAFEAAIIAGKGMGQGARGAARSRFAELLLHGDEERRRWERFCRAFPWGKYLSEGAYKKVYQIWSAVANREEAVSVMDIRRIATSGNASIVGQEIACALLLSELVSSGVCPNFVETYQVFQLTRPAPGSLWGTEDYPTPQGKSFRGAGAAVAANPRLCTAKGMEHVERASEGLFQYIRMELCGEGDLESYMKRLPEEMMSLPQLRSAMFQMFFSLYVARHRLNFRHYDVKLLNFFAKTVVVPMDSGAGHSCAMRYSFGACHFALPLLDGNSAFFVKLADYGTADTRADTLGMPVGVDHFATLENVPIDFLILGDRAVQHYASDTFCLGLAVLHLFTGSVPYEELMADVQCPPLLLNDLFGIWGIDRPRSAAGFKAIQHLASHYDCALILANTLYRYVVLFGVDNFVPYAWTTSEPVWRAVLRYAAPGNVLGLDSAVGTDDDVEAERTYYCDSQRTFSLTSGSHPLLQRARLRMKAMPGSLPLVLQLTAFDPSQRISMHDALCSPAFDVLSSNGGNASAAFQYSAYAQSGNASLDCTL